MLLILCIYLLVNVLNIHKKVLNSAILNLKKNTTVLLAITQHSVLNMNFNTQHGMQIFPIERTII